MVAPTLTVVTTAMKSEAARDTESVITTKNAAQDPEVVRMRSMNARTYAAIPTFAEPSSTVKWSLAGRIIRSMVAVRVDGSAADWRFPGDPPLPLRTGVAGPAVRTHS